MASVIDQDAVGPGGAGSEELADRLRRAVNRLNRRLQRQSLAGLSPAQASALGTINRLGRPTLGELAVAEQVQPPSMTRIVAAMVAGGLLAREPDPLDRRVVRVRLTAEGHRARQRIRRLKTAFLTTKLAELTPGERASATELVELLERLVGEP
ncbi:MAG TPA: MarR family transcriptional regulator [Acidimicrobiales bacterium]|nr:MarR family transcriptional regulator [Acidimicrobiales bacterium]